jgi:hypothetical protein
VARALLPPARAIEATTLLHLVIAGFGAWLFGTRLGLGVPARLAGSLAFMLSGPVVRWVYQVPCLSTLVWTPLILWAVHGLLCEARLGWAIALALVSSLAFLGGYSQGFAYEAQYAFAYGLFGLILWTPRGGRLRRVWLAALSGVVFLGLVAAQLLPTIELLLQGTRSFGGLTLNQAGKASIAPEFLLYGLFGSTGLGPAEGANFYWSWAVASVSLLALPLGLFAIADRPRRVQWLFFASAAVLTALFMLGPQTPVFRLYHALPLGDLFRVPTRIGFLYAFSMSMLVGIGVQGAIEILKQRNSARVAVGIGMLLVVTVGIDLYRRTALPYTHPVIDPKRLDGPEELVDRLRQSPGRERLFVVEESALNVKIGTMNALFAVPTYGDLFPRLYELYFNGAFGTGSNPWHGEVHLPPQSADPELPTSRTFALRRLLDVMSVRFYTIGSERGDAIRERIEALAGETGGPVGGLLPDRARNCTAASLCPAQSPSRTRSRTGACRPD